MVLLLDWFSNVIAEQERSAFPSTSTGGRRENMSQVFVNEALILADRQIERFGGRYLFGVSYLFNAMIYMR
jgi:hypothetical protein